MRYLVTDIKWEAKPLDALRLPKSTQVDAAAADDVIKAVEEKHGASVQSASSYPLPYATKALAS